MTPANSALLLLCLSLKLQFTSSDKLFFNSRKIYSPCDYPVPKSAKNGNLAKCSKYLGIPYICDPSAMLSLTEAENLDSLIRDNFTSCYCSNGRNYYKTVWNRQGDCKMQLVGSLNFGLAMVEFANSDCRVFLNNSACLPKVLRSEANLADFHSRKGQLWAEGLRQRWSDLICPTDIFILVVKFWHNSDGTDIDANRVYLSFSSRANAILRVDRRPELQQLLTLDSEILTPTPLQYQLIETVKLLTAPLPVSTVQKPPTWAFVLLICCVILSALLALIGHCVNSIGGKFCRYTAGGSGGERKWQAGFAGGMWDAS